MWAVLLMLGLTATPHVAYAPAKVTLVARRPYSPDDKWIRLALWCGDDLVTSSERQMSARGGSVYTLTATLREACVYTAEVTVEKASGATESKRTTVELY